MPLPVAHGLLGASIIAADEVNVMKAKSISGALGLLLLISTTAFSQQPVAPNAPQDRTISATASELQRFEEAIKPSIAQARKTYPEARERFRKGLPPKHGFFVTARLYDAARHFEQVFIAVKEVKDGKIKGVIASDVEFISGYQRGDSYTFPEAELIDWTISQPDGTEEGNFVGKFLDTYQPQTASAAPGWRNQPATPESTIQRIEEAAKELQANGPVPRVVFYNIGYPRDDSEYVGLDGHAVILITALTHAREELPLQRVYVQLDGRQIELKLIKEVLSEQAANSSAAARIFGEFHSDTLYLLPVHLRLKSADLLVDFNRNRAGFKVTTFGTPVPAEVSKLPIKAPTGAGPKDEILAEFIRREFPTFFND
jgi:hypothetical protein